MDPTISRLVHAACPEFPEDRNVLGTRDSMQWYKIIKASRTLMVPPVNLLRVNPIELDKFVEAVIAFAKCNVDDSQYDWDHLNLYEASTPEDILQMLQTIKDEADSMGYLEVAADIETRGLSWDNNRLLSIGFATDPDTCYAIYNIPIIGAAGTEHYAEVWQALQDLFNNPQIHWCWHNGKFDCGKLKYMCNLDAHIDEDTMLLHYVGINEKRGTHGLKELGQLYLQAPAWEDELDRIKKEFCRKNKLKLAEFEYDMIPTEVLIPYMQRDCVATYRLLQLFRKLQRPESQFIYRKLCEAANTYMRVELNGVQLDIDYLEELEFKLDQEMEEAQARLDKVAAQIWDPILYSKMTGAKVTKNAETFNVKSPKQLKWMLQEVLGHPVPSTDAAFIEQSLATVQEGTLAYDFLSSITAVRKNHKYMDTYVQGLREVVCKDGRIRGTFNLHGTETGRLSSTGPNMQNIPRDKTIKNLLVAKPGTVLVQLDYSQAELRVLAQLSGDPSMIECYVEGQDLHAQVAQDMFGPDFTKEQRTQAKTINFGIAYGRGPANLSQAFGITMNEARNLINKWYKSKPLVKQYIDTQRSKPLHNEPCTTILGRMRHFVITDAELNHIQNEYINTPIQSAASDMTMLSLLTMDEYIRKNLQGKAKICTTVHDSIILEVVDDPEIYVPLAEKCKQIMAEVPKQYIPNCVVPFKADVEVGRKWGAMYEVEEFINEGH